MFLNDTAIYNLSTMLNRPIIEKKNGWKLDFYFFETFISAVFLAACFKIEGLSSTL